MRRLHPATIVIVFLPRLKEAIRTALPLALGSFVSGKGMSGDWIAGLIGLLTGVFAIGTYFTTRFDIDEDHVVHTTGWIFRKDRRIPLNQIQNVNLRQGILERLFKVATVDVETALGKGRDLKLSVLSLPEAERLRDQLLESAEVHLAPERDSATPLLRLTTHDLLIGALTENHFGQVVIALFTLVAPVMSEAAQLGSHLPFMGYLLVICGGLAVTIIGAWGWGVLSYVLKYGNFVVRSDENIFRISYGLLNRVQMAIRPSRIEYVRISKTLPQRWMGRSTLQVGTAASFGEAGVLAPVALFVPDEVAYHGFADVIPGLNIPRVAWQPLHPLFYWSSAGRSLIWLAVLSLIARQAVVWFGAPVFTAWAILGMVACLIVIRMLFLLLALPENGFVVTDDALVVRLGYYHQHVSAMPIWRMENIAVTQPMWWRSRKALSLHVQGMKHRVYVGAVPEEALERLIALWRVKIETPPALTGEPTIPPIADDIALQFPTPAPPPVC